MISHEDFSKFDIRIGTILSAERVLETDKLIKLSVDIGEEKPRQIVAGIVEYVSSPEELIGIQVPLVSNMEPRTIKGVESRGMILAGSTELDHKAGENSFSLLIPQKKIPNGAKVR
ncbi:MAG: hypothetical protein WD003_01545 [Candidatus Paceibacterota bacterium]